MQGEYRLQVNLQKDRQDREVVCTLHLQRRQDCSSAGFGPSGNSELPGNPSSLIRPLSPV